MITSDLSSVELAKDYDSRVALMRVVFADAELNKDNIILDDGMGSKNFDGSALNRRFIKMNKLYQFNYGVAISKAASRNKVKNCCQPTLRQVAEFHGYEFSGKTVGGSYSRFWAEPIANIESTALFDMVANIQKLLAHCNKFLEDGQFCVAKPSFFCDFSGILNAVDSTQFKSRYDKDIAIAGAYLVCMYRSYFAVRSEGGDVTNFDHDILRFINGRLNKLSKLDTVLGEKLRQFTKIAELNPEDKLSEFCSEALLVKDFYDVLQPTLDKERHIWRQRIAMGLEDY